MFAPVWSESSGGRDMKRMKYFLNFFKSKRMKIRDDPACPGENPIYIASISKGSVVEGKLKVWIIMILTISKIIMISIMIYIYDENYDGDYDSDYSMMVISLLRRKMTLMKMTTITKNTKIDIWLKRWMTASWEWTTLIAETSTAQQLFRRFEEPEAVFPSLFVGDEPGEGVVHCHHRHHHHHQYHGRSPETSLEEVL